MAVLLTGGTGYIGSHTAVCMLEAGYDVVIADDLSNSAADVADRIRQITGRDLRFYQIDVSDRAAVRALFDENDIDAVIHFAGFKAVGESVREPLKYYRNNLDTTLTLLEVMAERNVGVFIFSSSATVYGDRNPAPYTEDMETGRCSNPYGWTKEMIERILESACVADGNLSAVALRYFNPIGAHESGLIGDDPNGIPNNLMPFITQTAAGIRERLSVFGDDYPTPDGTGVRDYIHVVDLAKGHVAAYRYACDHKGFEAINLGTGVGYSVLDIVKTFERVNGVRVPYVIAARRPGDLASVYSDPSKAKALLGWETEKSLEDMCRDAWNYQKNRL
ncbi:MAG: UDP-glucose 4-epimerase GalE [Mogibacterium sp.]|nr:UDP-glucose 4-epimerase GalE [Mogibacterium sp.]